MKAESLAEDKISDLMQQISARTDPISANVMIDDIYKAYGLHESQLSDGLPTVDPRTVEGLSGLSKVMK